VFAPRSGGLALKFAFAISPLRFVFGHLATLNPVNNVASSAGAFELLTRFDTRPALQRILGGPACADREAPAGGSPRAADLAPSRRRARQSCRRHGDVSIALRMALMLEGVECRERCCACRDNRTSRIS
jgi:hypothetical protein